MILDMFQKGLISNAVLNYATYVVPFADKEPDIESSTLCEVAENNLYCVMCMLLKTGGIEETILKHLEDRTWRAEDVISYIEKTY